MYNLIKSLFENPQFKSQVKYAIKKYEANDKILEQGKEHPNLFLIKNGKVRVIVNAEDRESTVIHPGIANLGDDDIFGEFALFDDLPASADVIALDESELVEIDIKSFQKFLETNPQFGYQFYKEILQSLVKRLRHADKAIFNLYAWGMQAHHLGKHLK